MKQQNKNEVDVTKLKDILEGSKSLMNFIESPFNERQELISKTQVKPSRNGKKKGAKKKGTFRKKLDKFFNWFKSKVVPENLIAHYHKYLAERKVKLYQKEQIKKFQKEYNVNHPRVLNLFGNITDISLEEKEIERIADLNKSRWRSGGSGPAAPLFYDPIIVDIHNEVLDDIEGEGIKTMIALESMNDKNKLALDIRRPSILRALRKLGKRFVNKRAKQYLKDDAIIEITANPNNDQELVKSFEEGLNYYGHKLTPDRIDKLKEDFITKASNTPKGVVYSNKAEQEIKEELKTSNLPDKIKEAMIREAGKKNY